MSNGIDNLQEFLAQKARQTSGTAPVNWDMRRDEWREEVERLYSTIEGWLGSVEGVRVERKAIDVSEQYIGMYRINSLNVFVGEEKISFVPVGTLIIGAHGRVDVQGPQGVARLILVKKGERPSIVVRIRLPGEEAAEGMPRVSSAQGEGFEWLFSSRGERISYVPLTPETLLEKIKILLG